MSDETRKSAGEGPSLIGRYQVTGTLGFGAMGAVYKAFDPLIKRGLAVKTIRLDVAPGSPQYQAFKERFYQEARISGTLSHPNIVTLFDIGEENDVPFLAMEFVEGKTIAAVLEEGTRFKPERVIALVSQVAAALDYAHSRGVVHRDIKPSNLIVYENDKVKVTDFGIAKLADSEITHAGALLGTPSYMSPEQAMGEKLDGRSDIFSLGVVAFEMLSGQQPFPGGNVTSILYKLVHVDPVEPGDLEMNGLVPQKWREVFHKVLAKKPENRYQTASAFVEDLEYCLGSWFTGIGDEETVTLQVPASAPGTVTIPPVAAPPAPAGGSAEPTDTLLLSRAAAVRDGAAPEATVALPPPRSIEELVEAPTVLLASPEAGQTLPPEATTVLSPGAVGTLPPETTLRDVPTTAETTAMPAPRRGLPVGWALGGAAAVAVVALGIVAWAVWQRPRPADPAPTPSPASEPSAPLPTLGALRVQSEPSGALVRLNGQDRGRTPLELTELPFGVYEVRVELKGYEAQTRDVSLNAGAAAAEVRVALARPAAAPTGAADVVSTPAGAAVTVDGRAVGRTPLAGLKLKPGRRRIAIALDEHETWTGTVDVAAGETGRVEVRLRPRPKPPAPPAPPTPAPVDTARVYANTPGEVDAPAKKLSGSSPSYPSDRAGRLKSGERVSVVIRFLVTEGGEVQDVSVVESAGKKAVDDVVVSAVRGWRYQPARKQGTPVKVMVMFKQTFLGG